MNKRKGKNRNTKPRDAAVTLGGQIQEAVSKCQRIRAELKRAVEGLAQLRAQRLKEQHGLGVGVTIRAKHNGQLYVVSELQWDAEMPTVHVYGRHFFEGETSDGQLHIVYGTVTEVLAALEVFTVNEGQQQEQGS